MANNKLSSRKVGPDYDLKAEAVMDINDICKILPHRYPFIMIDKILYLDENKIISKKNVTINEPYFEGHFPNNPIMPGVLQVEALAQTGAVMMVKKVDNPSKYWTYFLGIENCKFRKMVIPGDELIMQCELEGPPRRNIVKLIGRAFVGDKLACEAKMMAMIVEKDNVSN
ncbi:MAG: 3-hydroxyacyl-ACP dehydratase FabZ [Bacteroidetes bacterium]|nr:3-hydroxyacyl-ACP dehydratase FabZ [Bacteroidota bacterium]